MGARRKIGLIGVIVGSLLAGKVVMALWSSTGTGGGQARALSAQGVTVNAATGAADLYPGFTGGNVFFTLTNPNPYPVTFTSMTPGAIVSSDPTGCPASNVTVVGATGLTLTAAAGATSASRSIAGVVSMASSAPDGCQGVTFTITLDLTGSQA
jgi:hypothetical protein